MTTKHLTDEEIQDCCLFGNTDKITEAHLAGCKDCSLKLEKYHELINSVSKSEPEYFDFNVSKLVMSQLLSEKKKTSMENYSIWILFVIGMFALLLIILPAMKYIGFLFFNVDSITILLVLTILLIGTLFLLTDVIKTQYIKELKIM